MKTCYVGIWLENNQVYEIFVGSVSLILMILCILTYASYIEIGTKK